MRTIYYKEAPKNPESLSELLLDYINRILYPETFWSDDNEIQCQRGKNRSIDDLLLLANHYFPDTTIKQLLDSLQKAKLINIKNNINIFSIIKCANIEKPVIYKVGGYEENLIHSSHISYTCSNSKWSIRDLHDILNEKIN